MPDWTLARQIAFFAPADMRGKWHAAWEISHTPVCGAPAPLGEDAIRTAEGDKAAEVHALVCRRCLRLSARPGVTGAGMKR